MNPLLNLVNAETALKHNMCRASDTWAKKLSAEVDPDNPAHEDGLTRVDDIHVRDEDGTLWYLIAQTDTDPDGVWACDAEGPDADICVLSKNDFTQADLRRVLTYIQKRGWTVVPDFYCHNLVFSMD